MNLQDYGQANTGHILLLDPEETTHRSRVTRKWPSITTNSNHDPRNIPVANSPPTTIYRFRNRTPGNRPRQRNQRSTASRPIVLPTFHPKINRKGSLQFPPLGALLLPCLVHHQTIRQGDIDQHASLYHGIWTRRDESFRGRWCTDRRHVGHVKDRPKGQV